jgi:RNA polymerase sigma-70 factor (ECF subfamily)
MASFALGGPVIRPLWSLAGVGRGAGSVEAVAEVAPTLEELFRRHAEDVHRLVWRMLGPGASRADVEDLAQQIFLAVHKALPRFRGESKPSTWLYGIATRTVYRELRSRTRHRRMVGALEAAIATAAPPVEHPLDQRLELIRVWRCLLQIKPKKRVVFVLHEIEGLSGKEIARALQLPEGTVHTRLYHARRELMALLEGGR